MADNKPISIREQLEHIKSATAEVFGSGSLPEGVPYAVARRMASIPDMNTPAGSIGGERGKFDAKIEEASEPQATSAETNYKPVEYTVFEPTSSDNQNNVNSDRAPQAREIIFSKPSKDADLGPMGEPLTEIDKKPKDEASQEHSAPPQMSEVTPIIPFNEQGALSAEGDNEGIDSLTVDHVVEGDKESNVVATANDINPLIAEKDDSATKELNDRLKHLRGAGAKPSLDSAQEELNPKEGQRDPSDLPFAPFDPRLTIDYLPNPSQPAPVNVEAKAPILNTNVMSSEPIIHNNIADLATKEPENAPIDAEPNILEAPLSVHEVPDGRSNDNPEPDALNAWAAAPPSIDDTAKPASIVPEPPVINESVPNPTQPDFGVNAQEPAVPSYSTAEPLEQAQDNAKQNDPDIIPIDNMSAAEAPSASAESVQSNVVEAATSSDDVVQGAATQSAEAPMASEEVLAPATNEVKKRGFWGNLFNSSGSGTSPKNNYIIANITKHHDDKLTAADLSLIGHHAEDPNSEDQLPKAA